MTEQTYTLDAARAEIARRECLTHGHDYSVESRRTLAGADIPQVWCERCGTVWNIVEAHHDD
jgi:hypothetical protein